MSPTLALPSSQFFSFFFPFLSFPFLSFPFLFFSFLSFVFLSLPCLSFLLPLFCSSSTLFFSSLSHCQAKSCREVSKKHGYEGLDFDIRLSVPVTWTYSVAWEKSDIAWVSRWDSYLVSADSQIHWLSISNSCLIVLFLTGMVGVILMKTIHADFRRYSDIEQVTEWGIGVSVSIRVSKESAIHSC